jgi:hypothetical protein
MSPKVDLTISVLMDLSQLRLLTLLEWDLLIRQSRRANLLATLAYQIKENKLMGIVPTGPRYHLLSALKLAERQEVALRWEVECIQTAFAERRIPVILLKGAAYVVSGKSPSKGRMFSDVDVIVPKELIDDAEIALLIHGWQAEHHDEYDQRFFRKWMHEIPPLRHIRRGTTIDVHHTILPETARVKVNTAALLDGVVRANGTQDFLVLRPPDMLLHSATHLFHEGEFDNGLRDLFDLDALLREFGAENGFWDGLVPRAVNLGLTRPLYYALRYTSAMLGTPVPANVVQAALVGRPPALVAKIMDICYLRALRPMHPSTASFGNWAARFALYVRSHWIRMPVHLLAYHLGRKAFIRTKKPNDEVVIDQATVVVNKGGEKL